MTDIEVSEFEYAIDVPGRGYVSQTFPELTLGDEPVPISSVLTPLDILATTKERYIRMGCPDIADTVRLISRSVTVTRGEWGPL